MNIKISTIARKVFNTLFAKCSHEGFTVSGRYSVINRDVAPNLSRGWQEEVIAERQHSAFYPLLREMRNGNPREDFIALANAVKKTGEKNPVIFEVGCGSGWNSDVLECLLDFSVKYVGVDYSPSMIAAAQKYYPGRKFMLGDAYCLPIKDGGCDILLSGTVLMHLADYPSAIAES